MTYVRLFRQTQQGLRRLHDALPSEYREGVVRVTSCWPDDVFETADVTHERLYFALHLGEPALSTSFPEFCARLAAVEYGDHGSSVYRAFTADGELLYVGFTTRQLQRLYQHAATKSWWPDVARVEIEHHPDAMSGLLAEAAAIATERPRHNVAPGVSGGADGRTTAIPMAEVVADATAALTLVFGSDVTELARRRCLIA